MHSQFMMHGQKNIKFKLLSVRFQDIFVSVHSQWTKLETMKSAA